MIWAVYVFVASVFCGLVGHAVFSLVAGILPRNPLRPVSRSGALAPCPSLQVPHERADRDPNLTTTA